MIPGEFEKSIDFVITLRINGQRNYHLLNIDVLLTPRYGLNFIENYGTQGVAKCIIPSDLA